MSKKKSKPTPEQLRKKIKAEPLTKEYPNFIQDKLDPTFKGQGTLDKKDWKSPADKQSLLFTSLKKHRQRAYGLLDNKQTNLTDSCHTGIYLVTCNECGMSIQYDNEEKAEIVRISHRRGNHSVN